MVIKWDYTQHFPARASVVVAQPLRINRRYCRCRSLARGSLSHSRDLAVVSRIVQHASGHPGTPVGLNLRFSSLAAAGIYLP